MNDPIKIYGASCLNHAKLWINEINRRSKYFTLHSSWQNSFWFPAGPEESPDAARIFWYKDIEEIRTCDALICYAEVGDVLRGAICEVGAALALKKPVILVAPPGLFSLSTWQYHPYVSRRANLEDAFGELHFNLNGLKQKISELD